MGKKAIVFLADGFEETEALAPVDIMRRCGIEVTLTTINATRSVTSSHNITLTADKTIAEGIGEYDLLMIPGGMPGTSNLNANQLVKDEVVRANNNGKWIAAICAGPMILGQLGLLKGKNATCFPGFEQYLEGANVTGTGVVRDGNIITAIGAGASIKLGIEIVSAVIDKETGDKVASQIQMNK
ncbi:MAG: DJ-1/PfpI family protein [Bacteroidales bacterium]|nr:DJ-1/PfpI family protein [Bacteroidales bacterium]